MNITYTSHNRCIVEENWFPVQLTTSMDIVGDVDNRSYWQCWIENNIIGKWSHPIADIGYFSDEEDAILFQLTWL